MCNCTNDNENTSVLNRVKESSKDVIARAPQVTVIQDYINVHELDIRIWALGSLLLG
jgi:hypothetical protein